MRILGRLVIGGACALALAACRSESAGPDPAGGCAASCAEALATGSEPCDFDAPGKMAYDAFVACAGETAPPGTDTGSVCDSVLAGGPASPKCITAVEALMPPCSSAPSTCMAN